MARNSGSVVGNNLARGLITEATGLNFPDDAVTDAENVVFNPVGSVERRKGIDIDGSATALTYSDSTGVIKEFVWNAVAKSGGFTFLVQQTGAAIHFYELTQEPGLSGGVQAATVNLSAYKAAGSPDITKHPASFASGNGWLFITHPHCNPVVVRWNEDDEIFEHAPIHITIRDFVGIEDTEGLLDEPTDLTDEHHYNLRNQGWAQKVRVGTESNELGGSGPLDGIQQIGGPLDWVPAT